MRSLGVVALVALFVPSAGTPASTAIFRIDHVADGDTVDLTNGAKVRLVQIDTPEIYFGAFALSWREQHRFKNRPPSYPSDEQLHMHCLPRSSGLIKPIGPC
jgi:hypothetical protein